MSSYTAICSMFSCTFPVLTFLGFMHDTRFQKYPTFKHGSNKIKLQEISDATSIFTAFEITILLYIEDKVQY